MLDIAQFRQWIVRPALDALGLYSRDAEEMLVAICAHESLGGTYLSQKEGVAKGIYQMEPRTHEDLWNTVLVRYPAVRWQMMKALNTATNPSPTRMVWDMYYATFMARIFFLRFKDPFPPANNIELIWQYYKSFWNTELGAAKKAEFISNYNKFVMKGVKVPKASKTDLVGDAG